MHSTDKIEYLDIIINKNLKFQSKIEFYKLKLNSAKNMCICIYCLKKKDDSLCVTIKSL